MAADARPIRRQVQTLLTRLQGDVARFATLKLAAIVMQRGIERYRDKNQGPISHGRSAFRGHDRRLIRPAANRRRWRRRSVLKGVRPMVGS